MPEKGLLAMADYLASSGYLRSARVRKAMLAVDRALFVPKEERRYAYADLALPVGRGQTISAPTVVAFMLERLEIAEGMRVLEVGTGSGYNCALLAELVGPGGRVVSIDIVPELTELAKSNIERCGKGYKNISFVSGDGSCGYEADAPYDRITVTAAMPWFNPDHPLAKQLKSDGRFIGPVGSGFNQDLILYDKRTGKSESVLPVMFVPLVGKHGFGRE
jgi:protein-L-isoaspartate(D-aspartate) O-methyltransferase